MKENVQLLKRRFLFTALYCVHLIYVIEKYYKTGNENMTILGAPVYS